MLMAKTQLTKTPAEVRNFNFDFKPSATEGLATGETIDSSPTPTIVATPATGSLIIDNIALQGTKVQARYQGGGTGTTYHVTCTVQTALSGNKQTKQHCGELLVEEC